MFAHLDLLVPIVAVALGSPHPPPVPATHVALDAPTAIPQSAVFPASEPTRRTSDESAPPAADAEEAGQADQRLSDPGIRLRLTQLGIGVELGYVSDLFTNARGGQSRGGAVLSNLDLRFTIDAEETLGLPNTTISVYGMANWGASIATHVGDVQGVSNIEAPRAVHLYEAWVQREFAGGRASLLAGLYDLNSEFYVKERAGTLINASWGIGPEFALSGEGGPSIFPRTAVGLRLAVAPTSGMRVRAVILDGHPGTPGRSGEPRVRLSRSEGALINVEAEWAPDRTGLVEDAGSVIKAGVWWYTMPHPRVADSGRRAPVHGAYALAEAPLRGGDRPIWVFGHVGAADSRATRIGWSWAAGLSWSAPLSRRPDDELALGIVGAVDGVHFRSMRDGVWSTAERTLELTYLYSLGHWGALQPDLQWVMDPDGTTSGADALLLGMRVHVNF